VEQSSRPRLSEMHEAYVFSVSDTSDLVELYWSTALRHSSGSAMQTEAEQMVIASPQKATKLLVMASPALVKSQLSELY
jgi:hypothetical protein